jgi:hypothetical protein
MPVERPDLPALESSAFVGKLQSASKTGEKNRFSVAVVAVSPKNGHRRKIPLPESNFWRYRLAILAHCCYLIPVETCPTGRTFP